MGEEILLFWEHYQRDRRVLDESCLSNWFDAEFSYEGNDYKSVEQFMMAEKARIFGDEKMRKRILQSANPDEAMSFGRMVKGFNEATWVANRYDIVFTGVKEKFMQNKKLAEYLRDTGSKVLAQASPWDKTWGIGFDPYETAAKDPAKWRGENLLGKILMEVRELL